MVLWIPDVRVEQDLVLSRPIGQPLSAVVPRTLDRSSAGLSVDEFLVDSLEMVGKWCAGHVGIEGFHSLQNASGRCWRVGYGHRRCNHDAGRAVGGPARRLDMCRTGVERPPRRNRVAGLPDRAITSPTDVEALENFIAGAAPPQQQQPRVGVELIGVQIHHGCDVLARVLPIGTVAVGTHVAPRRWKESDVGLSERVLQFGGHLARQEFGDEADPRFERCSEVLPLLCRRLGRLHRDEVRGRT